MAVHQLDRIANYTAHLKKTPDEIDILFKDLLIGVTKFFRDSEAFEVLKSVVIPELLKNGKLDHPLRIWVAGCATGEEAYSLAILLHEQLTAAGRPVNAKIFATDVHRASLDFASAGVYSAGSLAEVAPDRRSERERLAGLFRLHHGPGPLLVVTDAETQRVRSLLPPGAARDRLCGLAGYMWQRDR